MRVSFTVCEVHPVVYQLPSVTRPPPICHRSRSVGHLDRDVLLMGRRRHWPVRSTSPLVLQVGLLLPRPCFVHVDLVS